MRPSPETWEICLLTSQHGKKFLSSGGSSVWVALTVHKSHMRRKWSFPWRASNCQPFLSRAKHKLLHCQPAVIKLSCPYAPPEFIVLLRNHNLLRLIDTKTEKNEVLKCVSAPSMGFDDSACQNIKQKEPVRMWSQLKILHSACWLCILTVIAFFWDVWTSLISLVVLDKHIHTNGDYSLCYQLYLLIRNTCSRWIDLKWSC